MCGSLCRVSSDLTFENVLELVKVYSNNELLSGKGFELIFNHLAGMLCEQLGPELRSVMGGCSVFSGGFNLDAAAWIVIDDSEQKDEVKH